jgi:outer membrane protein assembly factor BamB
MGGIEMTPRFRYVLPLASIAACGWLLLAGAAGPASDAGVWPAFRGPLGTGVAPQADPPAEWTETKNVRWKVPIPGEGHATPIIWKDHIFLLAAVKADAPQPPDEGSPAAPPPSPASPGTPAHPGVVPASNPAPPGAPPAAGSAPPGDPNTAPADPNAAVPRRRGPPTREKPTSVHQFVVLALDRATGATVWRTVVAEEIPHEGGHETASQASASPVTDGERLYAFFGSRGLFCLDMKGAVVWKKDFGDMTTRNHFGEGASPVVHGDTVLVNWDHEGDDFIVAMDKRTGEERWRMARSEQTSWSTPLVVQDGGKPVAVVSATQRVRAYDVASGEEVWSIGGLGPNAIPTPVAFQGLVFVMSGYQNPAAMAIRYEGARGDLTGTDRLVWKVDRGTSYVASPLLYDGILYFVDRLSAVLSARDFATGEVHYAEQRLEGMGNVYASPVGAAGRIYLIDRAGRATVVKHGKGFEVVGTGLLEDQFDASPVIAGDTLYLRGHKSLYSIAKTGA